jgi:hypothetical protein
MHQIVILTALTATSGLFGGGRHCTSGGCGYPAMGYSAYAPMQGYGCQPGAACGLPAAPAPMGSYPVAPPAPYPTAAYPAAPAVPQAPRTAYYPTTYYPTAMPSCAGGACYRR